MYSGTIQPSAARISAEQEPTPAPPTPAEEEPEDETADCPECP